jgi:hypothetical protein
MWSSVYSKSLPTSMASIPVPQSTECIMRLNIIPFRVLEHDAGELRTIRSTNCFRARSPIWRCQRPYRQESPWLARQTFVVVFVDCRRFCLGSWLMHPRWRGWADGSAGTRSGTGKPHRRRTSDWYTIASSNGLRRWVFWNIDLSYSRSQSGPQRRSFGAIGRRGGSRPANHRRLHCVSTAIT